MNQKLKILVDILKGLQKLHEQDYVHCDLKMPNILLDKNLNTKIADFGITKNLRQGNTQNT
jgi:serine/threonine protein kinase